MKPNAIEILQAHKVTPEILERLRVLYEVLLECSVEPLEARRVKQAAFCQKIIVATDEKGLPIGMATLIVAPKMRKTISYVHDVAVLREHQGKGVLRGLMARLHELERSRNSGQSELTSNKKRLRARKSYIADGYVPRDDTTVFRKPL